MKRDSGFTLVEFLIYIAIFSILAVTFSSILVTFTRVSISQNSKNEVASQLNFVMQNIQRIVKSASLVVVRNTLTGQWDEEDEALGQEQKYLIIKDRKEDAGEIPLDKSNDAFSPIVIYESGGIVKLEQGKGVSKTIENLTNNKVTVDNLTFTKFVNYPGQDIIEINLTLSYKSDNPQQKTSRKLILGVSKAMAAVFDTSLLPGAGNSIDIGQNNNAERWRDGYFSRDVDIGGTAKLNSMEVGVNGSPISGIMTGFLSVNPPTISANSNNTFTVAAPSTIGASDKIFLTPPQNLETGLVFVGARTIDATNQVEITLRNTNGTAVNGAAKNWSYLLIK